MYVAGFVVPVHADKMETYRQWAQTFRRAVDARDGEKIVFSWHIWPSKQALEEAEEKCIRTRARRRPGKFPSMQNA
jgi:uncharacterized protein YbaA (DUF1428 family)